MHILAAVQGEYGKRIAENVKKHMPDDWTLDVIEMPRALPMLVDEPEEFLPSEIPSADLLLGLIESDGAAQLIPALARLSGVKAAIVPVDNPAWLPMGLQNQIEQEMADTGVYSIFPRTFCTLCENSTGYKSNAVTYTNELISSFAEFFGQPKVKITLDDDGTMIAGVEVMRGAPCGSTYHVAGKLTGMAAAEAVPKAGLIAHQFPCLASMQQDEIDKGANP